jgi:hypothetical protein
VVLWVSPFFSGRVNSIAAATIKSNGRGRRCGRVREEREEREWRESGERESEKERGVRDLV